MSLLPLPIEIEEFLSWQESMLFKREHPMKTVLAHPFVSLSWEFGCEGVPLANHLARRLNDIDPKTTPWVVIDKKVVETISEKHGVAAKFIEALAHSRRSLVEQTIETLLCHQPTDYHVFEVLAKTILSLAEVGRVIILDLGAPIVLAHEPRGMHIRLVAPLSWRGKRVTQERELSMPETQALVKKEDEEHESFVRKFTGMNVTDPTHYNAVFNNAKTTVEKIADFIVSAIPERTKILTSK